MMLVELSTGYHRQETNWTVHACVDDGEHWRVMGTCSAMERRAVECISKDLLPVALTAGAGWVFERAKVHGYGAPVVLAVRDPSGTRFAIDSGLVGELQTEARIYEALSDMSTIGWFASYLTDASQEAWRLAGLGLRDLADHAYNGTPEDLQDALKVVLVEAAAYGWWPREADRGTQVGWLRREYERVPLERQHALSPFLRLRPGATGPEIYEHLASALDASPTPL